MKEKAARPRRCAECGRATDPDELMMDDEDREICATCYSDTEITRRDNDGD